MKKQIIMKFSVQIILVLLLSAFRSSDFSPSAKFGFWEDPGVFIIFDIKNHVESPSEDYDVNEDSHFVGTIETLSDTNVTVNGQTFAIDENTELDDGLKVGVLARLEYMINQDGLFLALEIDKDATDDDADPDEADSDDAEADSEADDESEDALKEIADAVEEIAKAEEKIAEAEEQGKDVNL